MGLTGVIPEIVVGVDFGMTCTGVAYSMGPDWAGPITIQHWPGRLGHENRNKVDTAIAYDPRTGYPVSWGFLADRDSGDLDVQRLFKLYLDPNHKDTFREQPTVAEARRWFSDYLRCIYNAIKHEFDEAYPRWHSKNIEFLFSVPTTWKNPGMIAETEKLIREAGFGEKPNSTVTISLTEAEAAAVYASKQQYERGEVFLVCDAGGGTTDVNVLKVTSSHQGQTTLEQLDFVEGEPLGSTLIDLKVEKWIVERLESIRHNLHGEPKWLANQMMSDRFETFKCSFGSEALNVLDLLLPIPGMPPGSDFPHAGIRDSSLVITRQELQRFFDVEIDKIFKLIDRQLKQLQISRPQERISYFVLSGGLGSSPYLKQRMRQRYEMGARDLPNVAGIRVLTAREPQLVVVHGLVMERTQELKIGGGVFRERCCRNSYGVVVRALYDPVQHTGEDVVIDPHDKRKWAERQIHWFIKQGEKVSIVDGIRHHYRLKISLAKQHIPWRTQIVMSDLPISQLPRSMKRGGVRPVCTVETRLNEADMKLKNRHWYNFSPQYYRAEFDVKVIVGPADLKFQVWGKNGQMSKDHNEIQVQWNPLPIQASAAGGSGEEFGMYRF